MSTVPTPSDVTQLAPFPGLSLEQIIVPVTEAQFADAADALAHIGHVGFDTETRPVFTKGQESGGPHIVQFATSHAAYIFQLHHDAGRAVLMELLQRDTLVKIGFGLRDDRRQIAARLGIEVNGALDLATVFRQRGFKRDIGVKSAVAMVLHQNFHKSKRMSTSNWALEELRPTQLLYAANDAYAALMVYRALEDETGSEGGAALAGHWDATGQ